MQRKANRYKISSSTVVADAREMVRKERQN